MSVIGIDLGTSTVKAGLFSSDGELLALRSRPTEAATRGGARGNDGTEADPDAWAEASFSLLRELSSFALESLRGDPIERVAVGGNGPTLVAVGKDGRPLRPALLWTHRRAVDEAAALSALAGRRVDPAFYLPKILWLMRAEPGVYGNAAFFLPCPEYVAYRLTGEARAVLPAPGYEPFSLDPALAARSGVDALKIPGIIAPGEAVGKLNAEASKASGLPRDCVVAAGLPDFLSALLGAGVSSAGLALDRAGSSEALNLCAERPFPSDILFSLPHPAPGLFNVSGGISTSGSALAWLLALLGGNPSREGETPSIVGEAASVEPGADGLLFLPYLSGERAPLWDPLARGAFGGLRMSHGPRHLVRALLESVAFALRDVKETMEKGGLPVSEIRCSGGPSRSALWNRIKADVLGVPIVLPASVEAEVLGSAAVALRSSGRFKTLMEASAAVAAPSGCVAPDLSAHERYSESYGLFIEARDRLAGIHRGLSAISNGD